MFVEDTNQVRTDRRVGRDLDGELAAVRLRVEHDTRRIDPDLRRPRIEFANGGDGVRGARLDGDGEEVVEGWGPPAATADDMQNTARNKAQQYESR